MKEFLTDLWQSIPPGYQFLLFILLVLVVVGRIIAEVYSAFKVKGLSGAVEKVLEVNGIVKKEKSKYVQDFTGSELKKQYRFNNSTKELVETGEMINVQKEIDSHKETSLQAMLDKYMPAETAESVAVAHVNTYVDKLDELAKIIDVANGYRDELGLGSDVSISDVYSEIEKRSASMRASLEKYYKEVNNNEKKDVKESE